MSEEWKDIKGFVGCYQVSSFGRIRSIPRISAYNRRLSGRIMTLCKKGGARLWGSDGIEIRVYVKDVVADHFLEAPQEMDDFFLTYIDGNPKNRNKDNLKYMHKGGGYITSKAMRWLYDEHKAIFNELVLISTVKLENNK